MASLLKDLANDGDAVKQEDYRNCMDCLKKEPSPGSQLLLSGLPELAHSTLLDLVQGKSDVEIDLRRLAKHRIDERGGAVYVSPMAKPISKGAEGTPFLLEPVVDEFLNGPQKVLLLLGVSGAGKTTFNRELDFRLWNNYLKDTKANRVPLLINLPAIDHPEHDLIAKHLRLYEFSEPQIQALKSREIIVICDGYDESQQFQNLYDSNDFNKDGWRVQMIVSCRSEYLPKDYLHYFRPARPSPSDPDLFKQAVLVPFSTNEITTYIERYVKIKKPVWKSSDYTDILKQIPSLEDLVTNPFLLSLSLEVLPRIAEPNQKLAANKITRVLLYDEFVAQWLERNKKRLATRGLTDQERKAFESLSDDGFILRGLDYLKRLSVAIYDEQEGNPIVEYSRARDANTWKDDFFGRKSDETQLLQKAIPMTRSGGRFGFVHRSILEYGVSRAIYEPQKQSGILSETVAETIEQSQRRMSISSTYSFETESRRPLPVTEAVTKGPNEDSILARRSFVKDSSVIQFLVERVQSESAFINQLLAYIEASKTDKKWRIAAANAITILVRAGVRFSHKDLRGINIPGADISEGVFDSAQLQGADLRRANIAGACFRQANLSLTKLDRARFKELMAVGGSRMSNANSCTPDGKRFLTGTRDGRIFIYSTSTWTIEATLNGPQGTVTELVVSPDGSLVVSCLDDTKGKLVAMVWDLESSILQYTFEDHTVFHEGIAFLLRGRYLARVSGQAVILQDLKEIDLKNLSEEDILRFEAQDGSARISPAAIAGSPDGKLLAISYGNGSLRLLDPESLELRFTLGDLPSHMSNMAFSSDSRYLAVVSNWYVHSNSASCLSLFS